MTELFGAACERNLMLAPANTAREIVASEQLAARDFFVDVEHPGARHAALPGRVRAHDVADPDATAIARPAARRRGSASTPPRCWPSSASTPSELARLRAEGVV